MSEKPEWERAGQAQGFGPPHPSFNSAIVLTPSIGLRSMLKLALTELKILLPQSLEFWDYSCV